MIQAPSPSSSASASSAFPASSRTTLPGWILTWFIFTTILCTWDACFILLRPHTFPGGKYNVLWYPYRAYIEIDQRYRDVSDGFVVAISLMNCVEVLFNLATLFLHNQKSRHTVPMGFTVSVMTFWKTVMYFLMLAEICGGHNFRKGNDFWEEIFILAIPNGIWVVLPFAVMAVLWNPMMQRTDEDDRGAFTTPWKCKANWLTYAQNNRKSIKTQ